MKHLKSLYLLILLFTFASAPVMSDNMPKKGTPEYEASKRASIAALDSVLKHSGELQKNMTTNFTELVMEFADNLCKKFNNDRDMMITIADHFFEIFNSEINSEQRYREIRKLYPNDVEPYMKEGSLFFQYAWRDDPSFNARFLEKAKAIVDTAKILFPNSTEPYIRWAAWQAPHRHYQSMSTGGYKHFGIDSEMEALRQKFPNYQGDLRIARYIYSDLMNKEGLSKDDIDTYTIDAVEFYGRANRDSMKKEDIINYARLCGKYNDQESMEKALDLLNYSISKDSTYPNYYRFRLWTEAALAKKHRDLKDKEKEHDYYAKVMESGKIFFEKYDSIPKIPGDYDVMATACMESGMYAEASKYYQEEYNAVNDTIVRIGALFNIMLCYYRSSDYDNTIPAFAKYEDLKRAAGKKLDYYDYQYLIKAYEHHAKDTTHTNQDRINYYSAADSILALAAEATPDFYFDLNETRLTQILFGIIRLEYGNFTMEQAKLPALLEAACRLFVPLQDKFAQEGSLTDIQYFQLMEGYHWALVHYMAIDDEEQQFNISEKMVSLDMPSEMELVSLSQSYKNAYKEYVDQASEINSATKPTYGKKKKKK